MRIIAGIAGSIPIKVPKALTRPTTDRVREAIFSSLASRLEGAVVLDLYAGSGSLGLESLSRGASSALFIEKGDLACKVIAENLNKTGLAGGNVVKGSVGSYLTRITPDSFDLVFADPPYARDEETTASLISLLQSEPLKSSLRPDGIFVLETLASAPLPESPLWSVEKVKKYGKTRVSYLFPKA